MFDGAYPPGVTGKMIDDLENKRCCGNCINYSDRKEACMLEWNNLDPAYYNPTHDRSEDDYCDEWEGEP